MPKQTEQKKNFFSDFRNVFIISLLVFIACLGLTQWVIKQISHKDIDYGLRLFQEDWSRRVDRNAASLKNTFDLVYNSTRTIAMLPGIQRIDQQGSNLEGDTIVTVQQIYHNLFSSFSASKIYVVSADLDPQNPSAQQKPIIAFDDFLTQKIKDNSTEDKGVHEYQEMKKQIAYFKRYFPSLNSFTGFNYPALFSDEIPTSDTSLENSRNGYVYSLPFYTTEGQFKGMISVIFRTDVFAQLLDEPFFVLSAVENKSILHAQVPKALMNDLISILGELNPETYSFFKSLEVTIKDEKKWKLYAAVPDSTWKESSIYKSISLNTRWIWMIGIILSFSLSMLAWVLMYSRTRALNLLNQMRASLESTQRQLFQTQKSDLVTKVTREMANDFQNNVTPILAYVNQLISKLNPHSPEARQADVIKKSAEKAGQVIQQLMLLSKAAISEKHKINLTSIMTKVHEALKQTLHEKVEVQTEIAPDLWEISGDASQLETVLMNLGFNARDAMTEKGTLKFLAQNFTEDKSGERDIPQLAAGYYIKIQVLDTGKGMTEDMLNKIFDPAFKRNKKADATGDIKLYTLHAIIADHKGVILVDSEVNKGTTFTIYLPALVDKPLPKATPKVEEPVAQEKAAETPPVEAVNVEPTPTTVETAAATPEVTPETTIEATPPTTETPPEIVSEPIPEPPQTATPEETPVATQEPIPAEAAPDAQAPSAAPEPTPSEPQTTT